MERRRFLTTGCSGILAGFSGCSSFGQRSNGSDAWSPDIEATEPTLSFAEESPLRLEAREVSELTVSLPDSPSIAVRFRNAEWSPQPTSVSESYPPQWNWSPTRSVSGEIPIQIGDHAEPGEYTYSVEVSADGGSENRSFVERFTITVTGN